MAFPFFLTDINIHSDTQAEPRKLSPLTLLWQEGKPAPGQNPPVISPPVVIFRRIGVRAEIRTQNPVLSNTVLAKMVLLSHLRRRISTILHTPNKKKKNKLSNILESAYSSLKNAGTKSVEWETCTTRPKPERNL
jgi:hypothetical protein